MALLLVVVIPRLKGVGGVFRWGGRLFLVVTVVATLNDARVGFAGESERFPDKCGTEGAILNFGYHFMQGELVEGYVFPLIKLLAADLPAEALGLPEGTEVEAIRNGMIIGNGGQIIGFVEEDDDEIFASGPNPKKPWVYPILPEK